jgi:hypothetical protein
MEKKILINNPHEGPEEHEFNYEWVKFSDGLVRAIYSSTSAPPDYWPREVYISDLISGVYQRVGSYKREVVTGAYEFICNDAEI